MPERKPPRGLIWRTPEQEAAVREWSKPDDDPVSRMERIACWVGRGVLIEDSPIELTEYERIRWRELEVSVAAAYEKGLAFDPTGGAYSRD
jgi:hypothetical protein